MKTNRSNNIVETTLGELIATISDVAFEYSDNTKDAYNIAGQILLEILKRAAVRRENVDPRFPTSKYVH